MINKVVQSFDAAVADIYDGAVVLMGGFGPANGTPSNLLRALVKQGAKNLTLAANTPGYGRELEVEMVPQGTLAERIRAAKAGVGAFFIPTGAGTVLEKGKEKRVIDGRDHILEYPLKADFALVRAYRADRYGNCVYQGTSRNFNPVMAGAAKVTIVEVDELVELGSLSPEATVTPGIYVDRIVVRNNGK